MLSDSETQRLESCLERRNNGEPVAYITGTRGFWDFEVEVNSYTLIPRPETEFLVETALDLFKGGTFLDLGTGIGWTTWTATPLHHLVVGDVVAHIDDLIVGETILF